MKKNRAIRLLKKNKVEFQVLEYPEKIRDTTLVAQHVGVSASQLFKSLVLVDPTDVPLIIMIPSNSKLDTENLSLILQTKGLKMAMTTQAEKLTGLKVGGISPLALSSNKIPVFIDQSVQRFSWIVISAGQRGMSVKLPVFDLLKLTKAQPFVLE